MANDVAFSSTVAGLQGRPISTTTPTTDQVLTWDGSQWAPETPASSLPPDGAAGGDLTGTYPNPDVGSIQGVVISGTPGDGYVLQATNSTAASWQALPGPSYGGLVCNSNNNVLQFVAYNTSENGKTLTIQDTGTSFSVFKIA